MEINSEAEVESRASVVGGGHSRGAVEHDLTLQVAFTRMMNVRAQWVRTPPAAAATWPVLWRALSPDCRAALADEFAIDETQIASKSSNGTNGSSRDSHSTSATCVDHLAALRAALAPGGACAHTRLSEGEAAAVLLYTAAGVYKLVNAALRARDPRPHRVLVATLVSALRKLRACAPLVGCVCRWTAHPPAPTDAHYVACAFLSATGGLAARPRTLDGRTPVALVPHRGRAAVVPQQLSLHPREREVLFEPGTAFRRVAPGIYEELPPGPFLLGDTEAENAPAVRFNNINGVRVASLVPANQCLLLYPPRTYFPPLVSFQNTSVDKKKKKNE